MKKAFTINEFIIVTIIILALLLVLIPNFVRTRRNERLARITSNLEKIERAKEECAAERKSDLSITSCSTESNLVPRFLESWPEGPIPGTYLANPEGKPPTFIWRTAEQWADMAEEL